jgi:hypothetical protein
VLAVSDHPVPRPFLTGERLRAWCGVLLTLEAVTFAVLIAGTHGWIVPLPAPVSTDFVSFYAAGALAWDGAPALVYDMAAHHAAEQSATEAGIEYQFFFYPPVFLLVLAPLSRLPYLAAFLIFEAVTLALYCAAIRPLLAGRGQGWWLFVLAFPAVFWTLGLGQNSFLTAAVFCAGLLLLDVRPILAGALLGALCYKPHIGILIPVALIAGGYYRTALAAAASVCALVLASLAAFGLAPWAAFIDHFLTSSDIYASGRIDLAGVVTPFAFIRLLGAPSVLASAAQGAVTVIAAALVWQVWRRRGPLAPRAAALLAATTLAVPVLLLYDLMLAQLALLFLLAGRALAGLSVAEKSVIALVFATPFFCRMVGTVTHAQLAPFAAIALLIWASRGMTVPGEDYRHA